MRYYDLKRHWTKKIEPHLGDEELNALLVRDFNKYTWGRRRRRFTRGMYPADIDTGCDWRCKHRGPHPRYWKYVCHYACHWLVNFALRLAERAAPGRLWRILTSDKHSTVWDGEVTLFEFNYLAFGIPAEECFERARGEELPPGLLSLPGPCFHWTRDDRFMDIIPGFDPYRHRAYYSRRHRRWVKRVSPLAS